MDLFSLKGKTALITGASRGIGEAIAKILSAHGARVILVSRKQENLQRVEEEIKKAGGEVDSIVCNVGKIEQIEALFAEVAQRYPKLDILVNNAGIWTYGLIGEMSEKVWNETMAVNLNGMFFITNAHFIKIKFFSNFFFDSQGFHVIFKRFFVMLLIQINSANVVI